MKDFLNNNDKVFREKISSHEFQFDSSAWDKMEKMLDDEDPRKAVAWRYPYMMMLLGFFFVGITLLSPATDSNQATSSTVIANQSAPNSTANDVANIAATTKPAVATSTTIDKKVVAQKEQKISTKSTMPVATNEIATTTKAIAETPVYNNTNSIINSKNLTPSVANSAPIEAVKSYIETIEESPEKRENIQAFMEVNSLLQPIIYDERDNDNLPIVMEPISIKKKKVRVGVQAGASVVLAKRSIADQGKIATAVGGFINLEINSKNTIAIEANYKNGYSKGTILTRKQEDRSMDISTEPDLNVFQNYVKEHGYTEVNNVERVHAVEIPVIYKRKLGSRNSVIAGVKPSLLNFKNSSTDLDTSFGDARPNANSTILDFGVVAGIEHQINKNLSVDLRYNQGLLNISSYDEVRNTNSEVAMTVKYIF